MYVFVERDSLRFKMNASRFVWKKNAINFLTEETLVRIGFFYVFSACLLLSSVDENKRKKKGIVR